MSNLNLTNLLAQQLVGYHHGPQAVEAYDAKPTNIVFAKNGTFRVVKTPTALFVTEAGKYASPIDVPGVEAMEAGPQLLIPKIPFNYLQMILSFYRAIHTKDGTEASVLFFWNHNNIEIPPTYADGEPIKGLIVDGQLVIYCPKQKNSSGLSEFHMDTMVGWLRENMALLCETHSHHTMSAFFSGTDDANENATQFYGVWGQIKNAQPAFAFRYVCGDAKIQISPDVLFDWPMSKKTTVVTTEVPGQDPVVEEKVEEEIFKGPFADIEFPIEWMEQHTKATVVRAATPSYYRGGTGGYGGGNQIGFGGAGTYDGFPAYDDEEAWAAHYGYSKSGGAASQYGKGGVHGGKKLEVIQSEGVSDKSLAGADVIEMHSESDFLNLKAVENEAKGIAEDLRDFGHDRVIESAIEAARKK